MTARFSGIKMEIYARNGEIRESRSLDEVCPGKPVYSIGRPLFDKVTINLPEAKTFTIITKNNSKDNKYIESAMLNGQELNIPFLEHKDIAAGGTLEITSTNQPTKWGVQQ